MSYDNIRGITFGEATSGQLARLLILLDSLRPSAVSFLLRWTTGEQPTWLADHDLDSFEAEIP